MRRLTPALLTVVMFGVIGLLVAAYVAKNLLAVEEKPPQVQTMLIPMAAVDIAKGTTVSEVHIGKGPFPVDRLSTDTLRVERLIVGRVAKEDIKAANPIRANQLYQPGELPPLEIAAGMRAVSVSVDDSTSMVDGLIKPGNHVDVLFTFGTSGGGDDTEGGITMRLFEGVKIIAINRNLAQSVLARGENRVTLELSEPQANILVLANERGNITLTYNPNGPGTGGLAVNSTERVTLYQILGLTPPSDPVEPFASEIFRGSNRSVQRFSDKGRLIDNYNPPQPNNRPRFRGTDVDPPAGRPTPPPDKEVPGTTALVPTTIPIKS